MVNQLADAIFDYHNYLSRFTPMNKITEDNELTEYDKEIRKAICTIIDQNKATIGKAVILNDYAKRAYRLHKEVSRLMTVRDPVKCITSYSGYVSRQLSISVWYNTSTNILLSFGATPHQIMETAWLGTPLDLLPYVVAPYEVQLKELQLKRDYGTLVALVNSLHTKIFGVSPPLVESYTQILCILDGLFAHPYAKECAEVNTIGYLIRSIYRRTTGSKDLFNKKEIDSFMEANNIDPDYPELGGARYTLSLLMKGQ